MIPVRVAIAPVMLVEVGERGYAIPLESVVEVVRYDPRTTNRRAGREFMLLRDAALPLMDMRTRLGSPLGPRTRVSAWLSRSGRRGWA